MSADQELKLKQLMKEQQLLKDSFASDVKQTQLFAGLINLLKVKHGVVNNEYNRAKQSAEQYNNELNQRN